MENFLGILSVGSCSYLMKLKLNMPERDIFCKKVRRTIMANFIESKNLKGGLNK